MKKPMLLVAMLAVLLTASVPAVGQVLGSPERLPED